MKTKKVSFDNKSRKGDYIRIESITGRPKLFKAIPGSPSRIYRDAAQTGSSPYSLLRKTPIYRPDLKSSFGYAMTPQGMVRIRLDTGAVPKAYSEAAKAYKKGLINKRDIQRYALALSFKKTKLEGAKPDKSLISIMKKVSSAKRFSSYFSSTDPRTADIRDIRSLDNAKTFFAPLVIPLLKRPAEDYDAVLKHRSKLERDTLISVSGSVEGQEVCRFMFRGVPLNSLSRFLNDLSNKAAAGILLYKDIPSTNKTYSGRHYLSRYLLGGSNCSPPGALNNHVISWKINSASFIPRL